MAYFGLQGVPEEVTDGLPEVVQMFAHGTAPLHHYPGLDPSLALRP
jgi:hypothetical protein